MSGWPNRIARSSFGPTLEDKYPVVNPKHDVGAAPLNLDFWQLAGMNAVSPRGLLQVTATAGGATTQYQGFAWDPNGTLPKLLWTRTGLGTYTFTLPQSEYPDQGNNNVTVELVGGIVVPQATSGGNFVLGQFELTGVRSGTAHLWSPQLAAKVDVNFLCFLV